MAITKCGCDDPSFFATALAIAMKEGIAPRYFRSAQEVEWFKALELGDLSKLPPEGYQIPECVRLLTNQVLGEVIPSHHCPKQFFRGLQVLRELNHSVFSAL
jgi:hypothetical protein